MKVKSTRYTIFIEIVSALFQLVGTLYLYINWKQLPDQIPAHYNAVGQVDRMGSKTDLLLLMAISWALYVGLFIIERFPQIWNTGVKVTEENKERVYRNLKNMLCTEKCFVTAIFAYLIIQSAQANALSPWFLPISLGAMFGSMGYFIYRTVH